MMKSKQDKVSIVILVIAILLILLFLGIAIYNISKTWPIVDGLA